MTIADPVKSIMSKPCIHGHIAPRNKKFGYCMECNRLKSERLRKANPEANRARARAWDKANKEKANARVLRWRHKSLPTPTRTRSLHCECCFKPQTDLKKTLALDHCHLTNTFRGWLCDYCNLGIGKLGDSLEGILRAADYLRKNSPAV